MATRGLFFFVLPWLALPHLALRIKPVRQFMMRVDAGFGLGFFFGGRFRSRQQWIADRQ